MDFIKLVFFASIVNALMLCGNHAISQFLRGTSSTEESRITTYHTSVPALTHVIKPSRLLLSSGTGRPLSESTLMGYKDTKIKSFVTISLTMNSKGKESITTATACTATKTQKLTEDITVPPSREAADPSRTKTGSTDSKGSPITPCTSFSQVVGFKIMASRALSQPAEGTPWIGENIIEASHSKKTPALTKIAVSNLRRSESLLTTTISMMISSTHTEAPMPINSSSLVLMANNSETDKPLYRREVDDHSLVFYSAAFVIGVTGNVFVLVDAFKNQKKLKTNEILLIHLCVVNVLILSTLTPMVFLMKINLSNSCHVIFSMTILYQYGIVYTLIAISIQHHKAITCPFGPKPTGKRISFTVLAIWIVSILQVLPMVLTDEFLPQGCLDRSKPLKFLKRKIYYSLLAFSQYLLPFLLILIYYVKLGVFLKKARLEMERRSDSMQENQTPRKKRDRKVVMVMVAMVITLAVCMLPQYLQFLLSEFVLKRSAVPAGTAALTYYPVVIKACLDPVIYGAVGRKLKSCSCCSRAISSSQNVT